MNDDIPTYKGRAAAPMALTADQYRDIRQALIAWQSASHMGPKRSKSILDILDFMVATGCRSGEALAVRWEDVDLQAGLVTFSGTIVEPRKGSPAHRQPHTKTEAGFRTVHVGSSTIAMLTRRASEYAEAPNEHGLVFPNARGGIFAPNNFRTRLRDALKFGDLEGFYPYLLRKTAARKIRDDVNLDAASAQLGHSSTAVTSKHYAGAVRNAPDVSDVMEEFLKASKT